MDQYNRNRVPLFHDRILLFVFTFFLGAFFGSLLYAQNLKEAGKKNYIAATIIASLLYNYFSLRILTGLSVDNILVRLFLANSMAAWLLAVVCWNYHFKSITLYDRRSIWTPLLAIIVVYGFFITVNIIMAKK